MAGGRCCVRVQGVEGPGLGFLVEHCDVQLCLPFPVWEMFLWEGQLVTSYAMQDSHFDQERGRPDRSATLL